MHAVIADELPGAESASTRVVSIPKKEETSLIVPSLENKDTTKVMWTTTSESGERSAQEYAKTNGLVNTSYLLPNLDVVTKKLINTTISIEKVRLQNLLSVTELQNEYQTILHLNDKPTVVLNGATTLNNNLSNPSTRKFTSNFNIENEKSKLPQLTGKTSILVVGEKKLNNNLSQPSTTKLKIKSNYKKEISKKPAELVDRDNSKLSYLSTGKITVGFRKQTSEKNRSLRPNSKTTVLIDGDDNKLLYQSSKFTSGSYNTHEDNETPKQDDKTTKPGSKNSTGPLIYYSPPENIFRKQTSFNMPTNLEVFEKTNTETVSPIPINNTDYRNMQETRKSKAYYQSTNNFMELLSRIGTVTQSTKNITVAKNFSLLPKQQASIKPSAQRTNIKKSVRLQTSTISRLTKQDNEATMKPLSTILKSYATSDDRFDIMKQTTDYRKDVAKYLYSSKALIPITEKELNNTFGNLELILRTRHNSNVENATTKSQRENIDSKTLYHSTYNPRNLLLKITKMNPKTGNMNPFQSVKSSSPNSREPVMQTKRMGTFITKENSRSSKQSKSTTSFPKTEMNGQTESELLLYSSVPLQQDEMSSVQVDESITDNSRNNTNRPANSGMNNFTKFNDITSPQGNMGGLNEKMTTQSQIVVNTAIKSVGNEITTYAIKDQNTMLQNQNQISLTKKPQTVSSKNMAYEKTSDQRVTQLKPISKTIIDKGISKKTNDDNEEEKDNMTFKITVKGTSFQNFQSAKPKHQMKNGSETSNFWSSQATIHQGVIDVAKTDETRKVTTKNRATKIKMNLSVNTKNVPKTSKMKYKSTKSSSFILKNIRSTRKASSDKVQVLQYNTKPTVKQNLDTEKNLQSEVKYATKIDFNAAVSKVFSRSNKTNKKVTLKPTQISQSMDPDQSTTNQVLKTKISANVNSKEDSQLQIRSTTNTITDKISKYDETNEARSGTEAIEKVQTRQPDGQQYTEKQDFENSKLAVKILFCVTKTFLPCFRCVCHGNLFQMQL